MFFLSIRFLDERTPFMIARLGAGCYFVPDSLPFLAPGKGTVANDAHFAGQVFLFDSIRHDEVTPASGGWANNSSWSGECSSRPFEEEAAEKK